MSSDELEKALNASLLRIIDFLKFSETKHAVLLTLASAWCLGITTALSQHPDYPRQVAYCLQYGRAFFVVALFVSGWSFLPKRKLEIFHVEPSKEKNLLFYGHIATYDLANLRAAFKERYASGDAYLNDLSDQVGIVSKIADRKFAMFKWSAAAFLVGVAVLALPTMLNLLHWLCGSSR